mgnify:CR=1 FL=1
MRRTQRPVYGSQPSRLCNNTRCLRAVRGGVSTARAQELLLLDNTLCLPLLVDEREDMRLWEERRADLQRAIAEALEDHGSSVESERFYPGVVNGLVLVSLSRGARPS